MFKGGKYRNIIVYSEVNIVQPVWLSWLSTVSCTRRLPVRIPSQVTCQDCRLNPHYKVCRRQLIDVSLSSMFLYLSSSFFLSLKSITFFLKVVIKYMNRYSISSKGEIQIETSII
ncbi:unnamed protein product [Pipistrellus nathusii]|uniref:Uncharacterized protein n=1 Tax=Pipistrellus nathusii TaxID=59473 RepID=A0ABP0A2Y5_PIPNA